MKGFFNKLFFKTVFFFLLTTFSLAYANTKLDYSNDISNNTKDFISVLLAQNDNVEQGSKKSTSSSSSGSGFEFYKDPSFSNFIEQLKQYEKASNDLKNEHINFLAKIFAAFAIEKNPNFIDNISKEFGTYSSNMQYFIANALMASKNTKALTKVLESSNNERPKLDVLFTTDMLTEMSIEAADDLDITWQSFAATGDKKYVEKILKFIYEDEFLLALGYEFRNRMAISQTLESVMKKEQKPDIKDILESIQSKYPDNANDMMYRVVVIDTALWSLSSIKKQDPNVKKICEDFLLEHPGLNYQEKTDKALDEK